MTTQVESGRRNTASPPTPRISSTMPSRTMNSGPFLLPMAAPRPEARKLPPASPSSTSPVSKAL